MADGTDERQVTELVAAVHRLTAVTEQVSISLVEMLRKQDEDRVELRERQKAWDEYRQEINKGQSEWQEGFRRQNNPWRQPREIAPLLLAVAALATAIAVGILAMR